LICNGISAPAALFSLGASLLPPEGRVSVVGFGAREYFFLFGVILLWFFVGRAIDHRQDWLAPWRMASRITRSLLDVALMLLGILVLLIGAAPILDSRGFANYTGAKVAAVLWLVWFLVLFFVPGIDLMRGFRTRRSDA
jgi:hypothetical protein